MTVIGLCDGCRKYIAEKPGLTWGKDEGSRSEYCSDCFREEVWKQGKICVEDKIANWTETYLK